MKKWLIQFIALILLIAILSSVAFAAIVSREGEVFEVPDGWIRVATGFILPDGSIITDRELAEMGYYYTKDPDNFVIPGWDDEPDPSAEPTPSVDPDPVDPDPVDPDPVDPDPVDPDPVDPDPVDPDPVDPDPVDPDPVDPDPVDPDPVDPDPVDPDPVDPDPVDPDPVDPDPVDPDPVDPVESTPIGEKIIRVGLYYGDDAVSGANIGNSVGSGFYFGYYDSENNFIRLGQTNRQTISVIKTTNLYYGTKDNYATYYENLKNYTVAVGCFHLQVSGSYKSFDKANAEAKSYEDGFVAYIDGTYYVRIGNFTTRDAAVAEQERYASEGVSTEIRGTSSYGLSVVVKGTSKIIFQYDDNGKGTGLGVEPIPTSEGEKCLSYFRDVTWHGGFRYERIEGGNITIVNMIQLDDYIKGVVCREMSYTWPTEALKAQAVAARCYALTQLNRHKKYNFDLCHGTHCHAYWGREKAAAQSDAAVDATASIVATYGGKVIQAFYYSSNGGGSESSSVVWGSKQSSYPYLLGVVDPFEETVANIISNYRWTRTYTAAEVTKMMNDEGYPNSTIVSVEVTTYSDTGNPTSVRFTDKNGKEFTLTAKAMQDVFGGLRSYRYDFVNPNEFETNINGEIPVESTAGLSVIDGNGNIVTVGGSAYVITDSGISPADGSGVITGDVFVIQGSGWGHNVGMSQYGAYAMAKLGYTYDEILKYYYTGIAVGELIENN